MQININNTYNSYSHSPQNKISFKGERLFPVNMFKSFYCGPQEEIYGYFTKMTADDIPLIQQAKEFWQFTLFGAQILERFAKSTKKIQTYMVECPKFNSPSDKIQALASVKDEGDSFFVEFIQSASELPRGFDLKGAGSMILYGITRLAEKLQKKFIHLESSNFDTDSFYQKHFFISSPNSSRFILRKDDFPKLRKMLEEKYNIPVPKE